MKTNYVMHDDTADVIRELVEAFDAGKVDGLMVFYKNLHDDVISTSYANMSYIERLGALEVLKDNMKATLEDVE